MPHKTDVYVGARLREARILNRLTQTDLANRLGISFQQVQKYEKGTNRIGASRLFKMTVILGVSVSFFFEGLADKNRVDQKLSKQSLQLAIELDRIDHTDVRNAFLFLLEKFKK